MSTSDASDPTVPDLDAGLRHAFGTATRCSESLDAAASSTEWIDGRYRLLGELGRGAMGTVHRAYDEELGREVALKILRSDALRTHLSLQRFTEEAQVCAQIQHRNVVPLYDAGVDEDGRPWFTMRLVQGATLTEVMRGVPNERRVETLLPTFEQILQAVAAAHERGVVHRDLKPSNVMLGAFGEAFVLDWGLAKVLSDDRPEVPPITSVRSLATDSGTLDGSVVGTFGYMPPEQASGETARVDRRCDVFALGSILCEMLTGSAAYAGVADIRLASRVGDLDSTFARLNEVSDRELANLAQRCLDPDQAARPEHAGCVAEAVVRWREAREHRRREAEEAAIVAQESARHERRLRRRTVAATVTLAVAILAVAVVLMWVRTEGRKRTTAAARGAAVRLGEVSALLEASATLGNEDARAGLERADVLMDEAEILLEPGVDADLELRLRGLRESARAAVRRRVEERAQAQAENVLASALDAADVVVLESRSAQDRARVIGAALREFGIDLEASDAGDRIRRSRPKERILLALNDWARAPLFGSGKAWVSSTERILQILDAVDDDPWRRRFRAACSVGDVTVLEALAASPEIGGLPPSSVRLLADSLIEHRRLRLADRLLRSARRNHESDLALNQRLAWVSLELGWVEDAVGFGRATEALRPTGGGYVLAIGLVRSGRLAEAKALAARLAQFAGSLEGRMIDVLIAQAERDHPRMAELADEIEASLPGQPWALIAAGRIRANLDQDEAAARCFEGALDVSDDLHHRILAGVGLSNAGRAERGLSVLEHATEEADGSPKAWTSYAQALFRHGRWQLATGALERAIALDPTDVRLRRDLGFALARLARLPESVAAFEGAAQLATTPEQIEEIGKALSAARSAAATMERIRATIEGTYVPESRDAWSSLVGQIKAYEACDLETRLWDRLRTSEPKLFASLPGPTRVESIRSAFAAAVGKGVEPVPPDRRRAARSLAGVWLDEELTILEALAERRGPAAVDPMLAQLELLEVAKWLDGSSFDPPLEAPERASWITRIERIATLRDI